jgi:hypothetical protein
LGSIEEGTTGTMAKRELRLHRPFLMATLVLNAVLVFVNLFLGSNFTTTTVASKLQAITATVSRTTTTATVIQADPQLFIGSAWNPIARTNVQNKDTIGFDDNSALDSHENTHVQGRTSTGSLVVPTEPSRSDPTKQYKLIESDNATVSNVSDNATVSNDSDNATVLTSEIVQEIKYSSGLFERPPYHVVQWDGWLEVQTEVLQAFWTGNHVCESIDQARRDHNDADLPILVKLTFGCMETFHHAGAGSGSYLSLFYAIRLTAQVYSNVAFVFECPDAQDTKRDLILPWITGSFPPRSSSTPSEFNVAMAHACGSYDVVPVAYMYQEIRRDLRKMATALVGVPHAQHPSADFVTKYQKQRSLVTTTDESRPIHQVEEIDEIPLYGADQFVLDDALIHFCCGDLMENDHPSFAFMTFNGYVRHISPEARSIGIITQPFEDSEHGRSYDNGSTTRNRCRIAVMSLVEFIHNRYPNAAVRIHNDPNETIALTYARMIMANQTVVGISSFGVFPAVATFGTGYIRRPDYPYAPNKWVLDPPIDQIVDNIVLFDEPKKIMVSDMRQLWQTEGELGILKWFWDEDWIPHAADEITLDANSTHYGSNKRK